mmetsp:Transcript_32346/g.78647  ORF Transcript_32346/g.78647 Transcript_32346/m.78647 type:complete len:208 (+) Transcript_32346:125-748(+)
MLPGIAFVAFSALASLKLFKCGPDEQAACFLLTEACIQDAIAALADDSSNTNKNTEALLKHAVVVDFGSRMKSLKRRVKAYRDLSPTGNAEAGVRFVQSVLEWAHQVPGAAVILLPMIDVLDESGSCQDEDSSVSGFLTTIQQRFRAETAGAEPIQDLSNLKITIPLAEQMQNMQQQQQNNQEGQQGGSLNPFPSIIQEYLGKPKPT